MNCTISYIDVETGVTFNEFTITGSAGPERWRNRSKAMIFGNTVYNFEFAHARSKTMIRYEYAA